MAPGFGSHWSSALQAALVLVGSCKVRTHTDSGTSSHTPVGRSDTWKARQAAPAAA